MSRGKLYQQMPEEPTQTFSTKIRSKKSQIALSLKPSFDLFCENKVETVAHSSG